MDRETLLVVFVGIIAVCVLGITSALAIAGLYALRLKNQLTKQVTDGLKQAEAKAMPLLNSVRSKAEPGVSAVSDFLQKTAPKVQSIVEDAAEISHVVRAQVSDLDNTLSEATVKARTQMDRVNNFVSNTLDTTAEVAHSLERGIKVPVKGVQGFFQGVKAGVEVLTGQRRPPVRSQVRTSAHRAETEVHVAAAAARARSAAGEVPEPFRGGTVLREEREAVSVTDAQREAERIRTE